MTCIGPPSLLQIGQIRNYTKRLSFFPLNNSLSETFRHVVYRNDMPPILPTDRHCARYNFFAL